MPGFFLVPAPLQEVYDNLAFLWGDDLT